MKCGNDQNSEHAVTHNRFSQMSCQKTLDSDSPTVESLYNDRFLQKIQQCPDQIKPIIQKILAASVIDKSEQIILLEAVAQDRQLQITKPSLSNAVLNRLKELIGVSPDSDDVELIRCLKKFKDERRMLNQSLSQQNEVFRSQKAHILGIIKQLKREIQNKDAEIKNMQIEKIETAFLKVLNHKNVKIEQTVRLLENETQVFKYKLAKCNLKVLNLLKIISYLEHSISYKCFIGTQKTFKDTSFNYDSNPPILRNDSLLHQPRSKTVNRGKNRRNTEIDLGKTIKSVILSQSDTKINQSIVNRKLNGDSGITDQFLEKRRIEPLFEAHHRLEESLVMEKDNIACSMELLDRESKIEELEAKYSRIITENMVKCLAFYKITKTKVKNSKNQIKEILDKFRSTISFEEDEVKSDYVAAQRLLKGYSQISRNGRPYIQITVPLKDRKDLDKVIEKDVVKFRYHMFKKELQHGRLERELEMAKKTEAELLTKLFQTKKSLHALEEKSHSMALCGSCKRRYETERTNILMSENRVEMSYAERSFNMFEKLSLDYDKHMEIVIDDLNNEIKFLTTKNHELELKINLSHQCCSNYKKSLIDADLAILSELYYFQMLSDILVVPGIEKNIERNLILTKRVNYTNPFNSPENHFCIDKEEKFNACLDILKPKSKSLFISNLQISKIMADLTKVDSEYVQKEFLKFNQSVTSNKIWCDQIIERQTTQLDKLSAKLEESNKLNRELNTCLIENTRILKDMNECKEKRIKELEDKISFFQSNASVEKGPCDLQLLNVAALELKITELQETNNKLREDTIAKKITIVNLYKRYEKLIEDKETEISHLSSKFSRLSLFCEKILTFKTSYDSQIKKFKSIIKWVMKKFDDIKTKGLDQLYYANNRAHKIQENMTSKMKVVLKKYREHRKKLYEYHKVLAEISACLELDFYNIKFKDLMVVLKRLKNVSNN